MTNRKAVFGAFFLGWALLSPGQAAVDPADAPIIRVRGSPANEGKPAAEFMACGGYDAELVTRASSLEALPDGKTFKDPGEGLTSILVAKAYRLLRYSNWTASDGGSAFAPADCAATATYKVDETIEVYKEEHVPPSVSAGDYSRFGLDCALIGVGQDIKSGSLQMNAVTLPGLCIRAQINYLLRIWVQQTQLGSSHVPCALGIGGETEGEWDVNVRDFVRILYYDREARTKAGSDRAITLLDDDVREHVQNVLISVSGASMDPESYSIVECGNVERSTGTPEDLAAEQGKGGWVDGVIDDLWEGLSWFLKRLILILSITVAVAAVAGAVVALGIPAFFAAIPVGLVAFGAIAATHLRVPETENHLLLIQTSKYLKNQILIKYYEDHSQHANRRSMQAHQDALKIWLLQRLKKFVATDFEEYNSIPYQRYSLTSLMNLYDFAEDGSVKEAALIVLDRQVAKFVVSSSQGRRFAPFRRLMERVAQLDQPLSKNPSTAVAPLSDYDFMSALAMEYFGDATHLESNLVHRTAAMPMMYAFVSTYRPARIIRELASLKSASRNPWFHEFRHAGIERYSRGKHYLLAAGGIQTDHANRLEYKIELPPPALPLTGALPFGNDNDRGVAWPTTLMIDSINGGTPRSALRAFLRIQGSRVPYPADRDKAMVSYDQNAGVLGPFAAGPDIRVPSDYHDCLRDGPVVGTYRWRFFSTSSCSAYSNSEPVHVAIFSSQAGTPELVEGDALLGDGLIEVGDGDGTPASFAEFIAAVQLNNNTLTSFPAAGSYSTRDGRHIPFAFSVPIIPPGAFNITGDVMSTPAPGVVQIRNPVTQEVLRLDMSNAMNPRRY